MKLDPPLPIDAVLGELRAALAAHTGAVLVAPPGAGKTTRVPLALMDEPWLAGGKILVLEPRRIAARAAAERMARSLGEPVGERIGLSCRIRTWSSPPLRRGFFFQEQFKSAVARLVTAVSGRPFFVKPDRLYSGCRRKPAMAINVRRNKPFGPGGSTRRLHQSPAGTGSGGGEPGSTRV